MNKIKITPEQFQAKAELKYANKGNICTSFHEYMAADGSFTGSLEPLVDFTPEQFAMVLCGYYEVEPKFKPGDLVIQKGKSNIVPVQHVKENKVWAYWNEDNDMKTWVLSNGVRHATPQEKFWFNHGRKVWEIRVGDVLGKDKEAYTVSKLDDERVYFEEVSSKPLDIVEKQYKIICFAENREDN